jgi:hypothetical protein
VISNEIRSSDWRAPFCRRLSLYVAICAVGALTAQAGEQTSALRTSKAGLKTSAGSVEIAQKPERTVQPDLQRRPQKSAVVPDFVHTDEGSSAGSVIPIDRKADEGEGWEFEDEDHVIEDEIEEQLPPKEADLEESLYTLGDSNGDGLIDYADVDCFVAAIIGRGPWTECSGLSEGYLELNDLTGDGRVDFDDIDAFLTMLVKPHW